MGREKERERRAEREKDWGPGRDRCRTHDEV